MDNKKKKTLLPLMLLNFICIILGVIYEVKAFKIENIGFIVLLANLSLIISIISFLTYLYLDRLYRSIIINSIKILRVLIGGIFYGFSIGIIGGFIIPYFIIFQHYIDKEIIALGLYIFTIQAIILEIVLWILNVIYIFMHKSKGK